MKSNYEVTNGVTGEVVTVGSMGAAAKIMGVSRQAVSDMVNLGAVSRAGHLIKVVPAPLDKEEEIPFYIAEEGQWREVHTSGKTFTYYVNQLGEVRNSSGKTLKPYGGESGYCRLQLGRSNYQYLHRIVAIAWLGDRTSEGLEVNHIDGDKTNNTLENLEWVTHQENCIHRELLKKAKVQDFATIDLHLNNK